MLLMFVHTVKIAWTIKDRESQFSIFWQFSRLEYPATSLGLLE